MKIMDDYSSWTRNRLTPEVRERIRDAGEGRVWFYGATGKPHSWTGCAIDIGAGRVNGVGPNPLAAFEAALAAVNQPVVSLLSGGAS